jgi:hypothetical protein
MSTEKLLEERQTTHGSFADNARVAQQLRAFLRREAGWLSLTSVQREALDMISCKVGRILSGQGGFKDHWVDLAGYASLAAREADK